MPFASQFRWMCWLISCGLVGLPGSGCIATDRIEFTDEENFPPSVISTPDAQYPLNEIGQLNLDDPVEVPEVLLETIVRDPNFEQTLEFRIFLDSEPPPAAEAPIEEGTIGPSGFLDRFPVFSVSYERLPPGECHKIELVVAGGFASNVEDRRPIVPGDFDLVTWWIEVTDSDNPLIVGCR